MKISRFFLDASAILLSVACACQAPKKSSIGATDAASIVQPLSDDTTILEYKGGKITAKDVAANGQVASQLKRFSEEAVEAYQQGARRVLVQKLVEDEAKKQGVSPQQLFEKTLASSSVTDAQVNDFIKSRPELKDGYKNPKTGKKEKVSKEDVRRFLENQNRQGAQQSFVEGLLSQAGARPVLELPRVQVTMNDKSPFLGGANAKVVIQEFSDFQCPYCSKGKGVVSQIKEHYGDKVKIVFRHFPLDFHPEAKPSALAAICAQQQGKFWELHDKMFDNQKDLGASQVKDWAKGLGLDMVKWEACIKDDATAKVLASDQSEAEKVGVNSTPTFFVNGKRVAGALPFEEFRTMIDNELKNN